MDKDLTAYAYWSLNTNESKAPNLVMNCSHCGYESINAHPSVCPVCGAIMVDPADQVDINGHDICTGDIITCNITGHKEKVTGRIVDDGQWHLENTVGFRWMYDCSNIEVIKGIIPEGHHLSREYENTYGKTH